MLRSPRAGTAVEIAVIGSARWRNTDNQWFDTVGSANEKRNAKRSTVVGFAAVISKMATSPAKTGSTRTPRRTICARLECVVCMPTTAMLVTRNVSM